MKFFLWTSYGENEVTEKTKYWVDLWEDIIENLSRTIYDRDIVNPHLILINLLDEIKYNKLQNEKNNAYFLENCKIFGNKDEVVKKLLFTDFQLLISELSQKSNKFEYISLLFKDMLKIFQNGAYFKESCNLLKKIILESQWKKDDEENIYFLSQNLIIELILAGYSIETIKDIPRGLFDKYEILNTENGEYITTKYPISVDSKNHYENGIFNKVSYNEALKAEINSLSISDRVEMLKYYFDKEPFEGYGIYHIEGLIKENLDVNIGEVNFYSPQLENYWRYINNPDIKIEDFNERKLAFYDEEKPIYERHVNNIPYNDLKSQVKQASFVNATVKIKYRDIESAKRQSLEIINKALDILRLYIHSKTPFRVKVNRFYLVNCEDFGVAYYSFPTGDTTISKQINSFNLKNTHFFSEKNSEFLNSLNELLFSKEIKKYPLAAKLIYSLHWYRKGFETDVPEDQLLNYWIAIENLITFDSKNGNLVLKNQEEKDKFVLVEGLVPYIELSYSIRNVAVETLFYLKNQIISSEIDDKWNLSGKQLKVPPNIINDCQLEANTEYKVINLNEFIKNLHLLNEYVTRKVIGDKIEYAAKFYSDTEVKKLEIKRKLKQMQQDLLLIYRYRNLIVHNAHFDHKILPYYVMKAENFARNLLDKILYEFIKDNTRSHQEILTWEKVKMERLIKMLENDLPVDLWDLYKVN